MGRRECRRAFRVAPPGAITNDKPRMSDDKYSLDRDLGAAETSWTAPSAPEGPLDPGSLVAGRFRVDGVLGAGGMAVVYRVRDRLADEDVALKLMRSELRQDSVAVDRFKREVLLTRRLRHPHVIDVYEIGEHAGSFFFTMALMNGGSLRDAIRNRDKWLGRPLADRLTTVVQIADALAYAHAFTVHRDIKPENILFDDKGRASLADFGIAKDVDADLSLTGSVDNLGTAYYQAPEQLRSAATVDAKADIYSLGVLLYEVMVAERPVAGSARPSDVVKGLPAYLDEVVARALDRDPKRRWDSAGAFRDAVIKAGAEGPATSSPYDVSGCGLHAVGPPDIAAFGSSSPTLPVTTPPPQPVTARPTFKKRSGRPDGSKKVWAVVGAAVLLLVGGWFTRERWFPRPASSSDASESAAAAVGAGAGRSAQQDHRRDRGV